MKGVVLALVASLFGTAFSQEWDGVKLGAPQFVAKRVKDVYWAQDGRSLAYTTETKEGIAVGVFDVDQDEGKILARLGPNEEIVSLDWLNAGKKAVMVVRTISEPQTVMVSVLDAHDLTSRQVWNRRFEAGSSPSVSVDVSPLLAHALLTVNTGKVSETWVLTAGGNTVVYSRDIALIQSQGQAFADWSSSGTALFTVAAQRGEGQVVEFTGGDGAVRTAGGTVTLNLVFETKSDDKGQGVPFLSKLPIIATFFARMRPAIPKGATVLECVPSTGSLRPVRFPGYFEPKGEPDSPSPHIKTEKMVLGNSVTGAQSLWLVPGPAKELEEGNERPVAEPDKGILVSAQADAWWPAPAMRSIAFAWNGTVFVRTVSVAGRTGEGLARSR